MKRRSRLTAYAMMALGALVLGGCTSQPFTEGSQVAIGVVEESFGDDYTLSAQSLSAEWTFTKSVPVTLSFEGGTVSYAGTDLEPGCYSGTTTVDASLAFDDAKELGL